MSKALSSYTDKERPEVIKRRLAQKDHGLGYWAAVESARAIDRERQHEREARTHGEG